ncbi:MAG: hypothetical protein BGN82_06695 [Alphaproteobacteria bacterium 65-7]|nr:MAG: hypothetical protein BGN82_06695 [Alphaproteobacteria bacterium 65-7]
MAILCGLGFWQLERRDWKLALIAQVERNMAAPPITLDAALALPPADAQYRHVRLEGRFDHAHESYVFTTDAGAAVYHVLTPFHPNDGRTLMVDRGEVPRERLDPATRAAGNAAGPAQVVGVWRVPDPPGGFTPAPDSTAHIWYARDLAGMSETQGLTLAAPVVIEADARPNPGGWPRGGRTVVTFRNQHLSYAVTWFGLAACLLGVWLAYHVSRGRIGWK